ncbi:MAG: holo-ACP synthase [Phycisphaeraceae bacterium]|nr:holo-ACP synthase [Phycisphaeraceae bacterium]
MRALAHGIDAVEVERVERLLSRHGGRFLSRVFTASETAHAQRVRRPAERLAARFAAKEAVMKALGTGWAGGVAFTDIEVTTDDSGRPGLELRGVAAEVARSISVERWLISLTHTRSVAFASVIALG